MRVSSSLFTLRLRHSEQPETLHFGVGFGRVR